MFHVPGFKYLLIDRHVAALEAAASRERLATEAQKWHAARARRDEGRGSGTASLRQITDPGGA